MKIKNPTNSILKVKLFGKEYELLPFEVLDGLSNEEVEKWQSLHEFIEIIDEISGEPIQVSEPIVEEEEIEKVEEITKVKKTVKKSKK